MKRTIFTVLLVIFSVLSIILGCYLLSECYKDNAQEKQLEKIVKLVDEDTTADSDTKFDELYSKNNDFVGIIEIPNTNIKYPVMQSKTNPNYYLHRNFNKEYSRYGTPYIQENCDFDSCDNVIIYGHNMKTKEMFHDLTLYSSYDFYKEHKYIFFDTKDNTYTYEVIAVIKTVADSNSFPYYSFVDAYDDNEYQDYVNKCKELSLYNIKSSAKYGDKLITLSTCEYSVSSGRFVVVAKRI